MSYEIINYIMENRRIDDEDISDDDLGSEYDYEWDKDFFEKFEWIKEKEAEKRDHDSNGQMSLEKLKLLKEFCRLFENELVELEKPQSKVIEKMEKQLYLYFVSLENNKMFLHADIEKEKDDILNECKEQYKFVQINPPRRIVYTMVINDLYDINKYVKLFMHMFGIDDTRGGCYTDIELADYLRKSIEHEKIYQDKCSIVYG